MCYNLNRRMMSMTDCWNQSRIKMWIIILLLCVHQQTWQKAGELHVPDFLRAVVSQAASRLGICSCGTFESQFENNKVSGMFAHDQRPNRGSCSDKYPRLLSGSSLPQDTKTHNWWPVQHGSATLYHSRSYFPTFLHLSSCKCGILCGSILNN